jgi:hypothetical protein
MLNSAEARPGRMGDDGSLLGYIYHHQDDGSWLHTRKPGFSCDQMLETMVIDI